MAWRGVVPMDRLPARLRQQHGMTWIGPHGHVVTYPLRRGELLNFVTAIERDDWLIESWSEAGTVEECRRDLARWHDDVLAIVDAIDVPYKWAMLGREPLQRWSVGRVSLLGDACHPTLPFLAQGANMAIEDGMVLARCLDAYDIPEALRRYEAARSIGPRASCLARWRMCRATTIRSLPIRPRRRRSWHASSHHARWARGTTGCMNTMH